MDAVAEQRRTEIQSAISRFQTSIDNNHIEIRGIESDIERLRTQRWVVQENMGTAAGFHNSIVETPNAVSQRLFRGDNRDNLSNKLEGMREIFFRQMAGHNENIATINEGIAALEESERRLISSNRTLENEISSLRRELRRL